MPKRAQTFEEIGADERRRLETEGPVRTETGSGGFSVQWLSDELYASSAAALEAVRPEIQDLRRDHFGSPAQPFPNYEAGVRWLEKQIRTQPAQSQADRKRASELIETEIPELCVELQHLGHRVRVSYSVPELGYWVVEKDTLRVVWSRTTPGSDLSRLAATLQRLSNRTGFSQPGLVAHLLCGYRPLRVAAEVLPRTEVFGDVYLASTDIVLRRPLRFDELYSLHRLITKSWPHHPTRTRKSEHRQFLTVLVQRKRETSFAGPWSQGFWEDEVLPEWVAAGMPEISWKALRQRYRRILETRRRKE